MEKIRQMLTRKKKRNDTKEDTRIIGIVGAGRHVGVTHLTVLLANYFSSICGEHTAALEWNGHGDFDRFGRACTGEAEAECYEIQDVSFYPRGDGAVLGECLRKHYEKIVVDFGVLGEQEKAELLRCQKVYLVISFSEWQEGAFGNQNHWEQEAVTYGWHCLAAFGSEESRNKWNQVRHPAVDRIPLSADAFSIVPEQIQWLDQLR